MYSKEEEERNASINQKEERKIIYKKKNQIKPNQTKPNALKAK
jgi:hypothetical protein